MRTRARGLACIMGMMIFSLFADGGVSRRMQPPWNQPELEEILKKSGAYCDRLAHSALYFVCREKVEEESHYEIYNYWTHRERGGLGIPIPPTVHTDSWVYDYQLIKQENRYEENRCLLEENGHLRHEDHARLKTHFFYSQRSILGPVGLLRTENQESYDYRILKKERAAGRKAWVLKVRPREAASHNPNYGKIWVDAEDFSVLKIEVEADSLAGYNRPRISEAVFAPTVIHLYGIEKSGLRFPSETLFSQKYDSLNRYSKRRSSLTKRSTRFTYSGYRFFTVEVDVRVKGDR